MAKDARYSRIEELAKTGTLEEFNAELSLAAQFAGIFAHARDALRTPGLAHDTLWWQKNEAYYIASREKKVPAVEELALPARVAFELAGMDARLNFAADPALGKLSISFASAVNAQVEDAINAAQAEKYNSTRFILSEKITKPFQNWMTANRADILARLVKYPDSKIVVDRLPEDGANFALHYISRKEQIDAIIKNKLRTTRDLVAPEKASFRKRQPAPAV